MAVLHHNSHEFLDAYFAAAPIGAILNPLNTRLSPGELTAILKETLNGLPAETQFRYKAMTGRPMIGVELRVVRPDGKDIAADGREVGEIIVRGETVSPGYWRRPRETREAFRDGWLHTGDLAVRDPEGYLNIVDRKKDMIVTGGENVYSTEVENILYAHPDILEAAVIGVPDDHWGEAVKACVVLKKGKTADAGDIIAFCRKRIAAYKVPKSIDFLPELPRTGSGKLFKKALKERKSFKDRAQSCAFPAGRQWDIRTFGRPSKRTRGRTARILQGEIS